MTDRKARARGCLLGHLCGDALGAPVEFMSAAEISAAHPEGLRDMLGGGRHALLAGQVTDDSELALALARTLAGEGCYDGERVAAAYVGWHRSGPFALGRTIARAFSGFPETPSLERGLAERADPESQANGALMRASPLGLLGWGMSSDDLGALAARDARLSHPHPLCRHANVLYVHAIAHAIRTGASGPEVYAATLAFAGERRWVPDVLADLEAAREEPPREFQEHMGWVRIAFKNAFHLLARGASFEDGLRETVARGGDADTNAAIAGALLGAVHGVEAVPTPWAKAVLTCETKRGFLYQTRDALLLADALLAAGER